MSAAPVVDYRTDPSQYRHWKLSFDGPVATLAMDVAEDGGINPGYKLKLNSYDLGVDIELHDALQRVVQLDVDAEIVAVELELVPGLDATVFGHVHRQRGDRAVEAELPVAVLRRIGAIVDDGRGSHADLSCMGWHINMHYCACCVAGSPAAHAR